MLSLQFQPTNDSARSTFSQLVCARKMTAEVLEPHRVEIQRARDDLASRLRELITRLEDEGEVVGAVAQDCAFAYAGPAVESKDGHVQVQLPLGDEASGQVIGGQLLERFRAASLGRGQWSVKVSPAARDWAASNEQRDYFAWRLTLPLGRAAPGQFFSPAELEDGLHEAVYGALLAQAAVGGTLSGLPYPGNLHVSLDGVREILPGPAEGLVELHHARFSANIAGADNLFLGVELMGGSGLIVRAK